jgi:hypothetical protein
MSFINVPHSSRDDGSSTSCTSSVRRARRYVPLSGPLPYFTIPPTPELYHPSSLSSESEEEVEEPTPQPQVHDFGYSIRGEWDVVLIPRGLKVPGAPQLRVLDLPFDETPFPSVSDIPRKESGNGPG